MVAGLLLAVMAAAVARRSRSASRPTNAGGRSDPPPGNTSMIDPDSESESESESGQPSEPTGFSLALPEGWVGGAGTGVPEGLAYQARLVGAAAGDAPVEATLAVVFQTLDGVNDPQAMLAELVAGGRAGEVELVELTSGPAVRRMGRHREGPGEGGEVREAAGRQYYLRVPGTGDQIAILSFATPTLAEEERLGEVFEAMAQTFAWA